jgi:ketosteroid isomerase-like protein
MHTFLVAVTLLAFAQGSTAAPEKTTVMATVQKFVDAFNKGDAKTAAALCADQSSIIDEFPPYEWRGTGACAKWSSDYDADAKKNNVTDGSVTLGRPRHVDVSGDRAYVVVPADYAYKKDGKPVKETASTLTIALQRTASGWRIVAWSWAKN